MLLNYVCDVRLCFQYVDMNYDSSKGLALAIGRWLPYMNASIESERKSLFTGPSRVSTLPSLLGL